ncbi:MAG: hypothetical protein QM762_24590 [Chryseolinea sp.]
MAHHHVEVKEELYEFKPATRSKLYILLVVGIVLAAIGFFTGGDGSHEEGGHGGGHSAVTTEKMVASVDQEHPQRLLSLTTLRLLNMLRQKQDMVHQTNMQLRLKVLNTQEHSMQVANIMRVLIGLSVSSQRFGCTTSISQVSD